MKKGIVLMAGCVCLCLLLCLSGCKSVSTPQKTGEPTPTPLPLAGLVIGIDPGHQAKADYDQEPIAPGSTTSKAKVSAGTRGLVSGVYEYEVNLQVGLKLKAVLESLGATVVMTRETNDVNISNSQRAKLFNEYETNYAIRLHCNGNKNTEKHGALVLIPTENPYLKDCERASELLLDAYCETTGEDNLGIVKRSDQTGFNYCDRMILNIEMGYLTNADEEQKLIDDDYQQLMAQGIAEGILRYSGAQTPECRIVITESGARPYHELSGYVPAVGFFERFIHVIIWENGFWRVSHGLLA